MESLKSNVMVNHCEKNKGRCKGFSKNILILFFVLCLSLGGIAQVNKLSLDQKISFEKTEGSLLYFLEWIKKQNKVQFSYNDAEIPLLVKVKISRLEMTLAEALTELTQKSGLTYKVIHDMVILKKQRKYTISGYIHDEKSRERLIGATVYDIVGKNGTSSNNYGFYSLTLPEGHKKLDISFVGYQTKTLDWELVSDTVVVIDLIPGISLGEIRINPNTVAPKIQGAGMSAEYLSAKSIRDLPYIGGEVDLLRALHFLPGVQQGSDVSTGLVVRGGSPEQNLILLDGVPVYNSNHAFGLFSVFNSDAIKNVTFIKGGFPARYGGRLSSVIDVRTKEGDMKETHGSVDVGLISSKAMIEGPIIADKASFMVSARRTYIDIFLPKEIDDEDIPSFFYTDLNAKMNFQISDNDRMFISYYNGKDKFYEQDNEDSDDSDILVEWGNQTTMLRWNHLFGNKLFGNLSLLYSSYGLNIDTKEFYKENGIYTDKLFNYKSGIKDWSCKIDFDYFPDESHKVKFGADYVYHHFDPGNLDRIFQKYTLTNGIKKFYTGGNIHETGSNFPIYANEYRGFIEDEIKVNEQFEVNLGIHYSGFHVNSKYYSSFEPRVSGSYLIKENITLNASFSRMKQYIHLLAQSSLGLPTDLWLPVTEKVKPQYLNQYTLGMVYYLNKTYEISGEAYYKPMSQLYEYKYGADYLSANNTWQDNIDMGEGKAYGLEFMLKKNLGKLTGWITYARTKSERQCDEIDNGTPFPYKYDRPNQVTLVCKYNFDPKFSLNSTWIYATGMAYTLSYEKYSSLFNLYQWNTPDSPSGYIDVIDQRNNARMKDYHRLDISFVYVKEKKKTKRIWQIGACNVYARFNPYVMYWDNDQNDSYKRKLKQVALFTILPSLSYRIEF